MLPLLHLVLPLFLIPLAVRGGMYGDPVLNLDAKSFKKAMATEASSVYTIRMDEADRLSACSQYQIKGFPTIKAFPRAGKGAARDYNGERKTGALVEYAKSLVPDRVRKLRMDEGAEVVVQKFLEEKPKLPHALLIHPSAPSIPFLWKVLGHRLSNKMHLGYIKDTASHSLLSSLGLYDAKDSSKDTARAVIWNGGVPNRAEVIEYDGVLKFNALLEWLNSHLDSPSSPPTGQKPLAGVPTSDTPEEKAAKLAKLQAKLDEEERRDRARREKVAAGSTEPSRVEEAAEAVPGEAVTEEMVGGSVVDEAAPPIPPAAAEVETAEEQDEPVQTGHVGDELASEDGSSLPPPTPKLHIEFADPSGGAIVMSISAGSHQIRYGSTIFPPLGFEEPNHHAVAYSVTAPLETSASMSATQIIQDLLGATIKAHKDNPSVCRHWGEQWDDDKTRWVDLVSEIVQEKAAQQKGAKVDVALIDDTEFCRIFSESSVVPLQKQLASGDTSQCTVLFSSSTANLDEERHIREAFEKTHIDDASRR
ncbi:hypothetical protein P7C73_g3754, partial [Tremellales sp. Uapishka_1]